MFCCFCHHLNCYVKLLWPRWLFSLQRREGWDLLERGGHLHPRLPGVWRGGGSIFWWIWTKWILKRKRTFGKETRKRWGQFCPLAALCSSSWRARGCQLHHEGDRKLHRAFGSPNNGESPNFKFQGASPNEQEKRDGWCPNWENAISEVGRQLWNRPRMEVPSDFFSTTSEEKWRTGRWSLEGDGGEVEEKLLFLSKKAKCLWLEPVLGGVICPVRWHPPDDGRK